jgi:vacuolar-type H+-ATPase subunit E/Vma4
MGMNDLLTKVQTDLSKLQKTLEREGETLLKKIKEAADRAANNKNVVNGRKEIEKLVETQYKKFEPTIDRFYTDLKSTAKKYGVNLDTLEKSVKTTTAKAADHLPFRVIKSQPHKTVVETAVKTPKKAGGTGRKKAAAKKA